MHVYGKTGSGRTVYKTANISETVEDRANVTRTLAFDSIAAKCMTLNDLHKRDSRSYHKSHKMTKYSLVMTPTPRTVAGRIISIRPMHSCTRALTYLVTYLHIDSERIKPAITPKRLKVQPKLLLTAYMKSYMAFDWLQNV